MTDTSPLLSGYPVITTVPILWGDEDSFAHVNNLTYLRWCESARVDYLMKVAMWIAFPPTGPGPILASMSCDYKIPLTFPDTVDIGTRVSSIGNSSVRMEHIVVSRKLAVAAAMVDSTLVMYDYAEAHPIRVPDEIRAAICELEGRPVEA